MPNARNLAVRLWRTPARSVETVETIRCPFCGQAFETTVDTSMTFQRFTIDCEVCCRPMEISVECAPGEVLSLEVRGD